MILGIHLVRYITKVSYACVFFFFLMWLNLIYVTHIVFLLARALLPGYLYIGKLLVSVITFPSAT